MSQKNEREMSEGSRLQKIGSAVFFGLSSILIVFINKSGERVFKVTGRFENFLSCQLWKI